MNGYCPPSAEHQGLGFRVVPGGVSIGYQVIGLRQMDDFVQVLPKNLGFKAYRVWAYDLYMHRAYHGKATDPNENLNFRRLYLPRVSIQVTCDLQPLALNPKPHESDTPHTRTMPQVFEGLTRQEATAGLVNV